jgi:hypothetical protein
MKNTATSGPVIALSWAVAASGALAADAQGTASKPSAAPALSAFEQFNKDSKHPVPWLTWGADLRIRDEFHNNASVSIDFPLPGGYHEFHYQRFRARGWATVTPVTNLNINARLTWESRNYITPGAPYALHGFNLDEALLDNLNVDWTNILGQPLGLKVGRQDITLGNGWLVADGTPLDGSRTFFFDAARMSYAWQDVKTKFDLIYIDQSARSDRWLPPINQKAHRLYLMEQDERGVIFYVSNRSVRKTLLEGFFIYKQDERKLANGNQGELFAFGGRAEYEPNPHWKLRGEFAPEYGNKNGADVAALGANTRASYFLKDSWNLNFRVGYEFLSGDDPRTKANENFDPLWGRWPQFSELLVYNRTTGPRAVEWTDFHRPNVGWGCNPTKRIELASDYSALIADHSPKAGRGINGDGSFRGHLLTSVFRYTFNQHVKGYLLGEWFWPGDYYTTPATKDLAMFVRAEMSFTW